MNRHMTARRSLLATLHAIVLLCVATPSAGQVQRTFPAEALRGALVVVAAPEVLLNGTPARLAPGARIRGQNNMLAMSGSLTGYKMLVHYTLDGMGQIKDVWILTAAEAARVPWPATPQEAQAWRFDAAAQTWTRP